MKYLFSLLALTIATAEAREPYETCQSALIVRLDKGETMRGPIYSVIVPHHTETFTLTDGMELKGPMIIIMCDGHLTITKP